MRRYKDVKTMTVAPLLPFQQASSGCEQVWSSHRTSNAVTLIMIFGSGLDQFQQNVRVSLPFVTTNPAMKFLKSTTKIVGLFFFLPSFALPFSLFLSIPFLSCVEISYGLLHIAHSLTCLIHEMEPTAYISLGSDPVSSIFKLQ